MTVTDSLRRHSIWVFFLLSYLFSWVCWIPLSQGSDSGLFAILGRFGPTFSALFLLLLYEGREGVGDIITRLKIWRVGLRWYLFAFFSTAIIVLLSIWISVLIYGYSPIFNDPRQLYLIIPAFLYVLFLSVLGEEIGWRGYALPRLQGRYSALTSSVIIGVIWSLWHLPLFWMEGDFHSEIPLSLFLIQSVAVSIIYTWMYNNTGGSLLFSHLFHAASNTTLGVLPVLPVDTGGSLEPLWITVVFLCILASVITYIYGPKDLTKGLPAKL